MCGLSLAWVTCENSTMLLESDILRLFFTGPYLVSSPLCSRVWCWLPLRGSTPTSLFASLLSSLNCLLSALQPPTASLGLLPPTPSRVQQPTVSLWVASSTLVRVPLPLPDTARFHVQESFVWFRAKTDSSALAAYPHSATPQIINTIESPLLSHSRQMIVHTRETLSNELQLFIITILLSFIPALP